MNPCNSTSSVPDPNLDFSSTNQNQGASRDASDNNLAETDKSLSDVPDSKNQEIPQPNLLPPNPHSNDFLK